MTLIRYPAIGIALLLASFGSAFSAEGLARLVRKSTSKCPRVGAHELARKSHQKLDQAAPIAQVEELAA